MVDSIMPTFWGRIHLSGCSDSWGHLYPTSFGVDLNFPILDSSKTLTSKEFNLLRGKIEGTFQSWAGKYQRYLDMQHKENRAESVEEKNHVAKKTIDSLANILCHTLDVDDSVDWNAIKRKDTFRINPEELSDDGKIPNFIQFNYFGKPTEFAISTLPTMPSLETVKNDYGLLSRIFRSNAIKVDFENRCREWKRNLGKTKNFNSERETLFNQVILAFNEKKKVFEEEKQLANDTLENTKIRYKEKDARAIEEYCDLVLNASEYPDYFPFNWDLEYNADNNIVVVEYELPAPEKLPKVESLCCLSVSVSHFVCFSVSV